MACTRCPAEAVVDRPYAGDRLCSDHFRSSVEQRVRREFHRQAPGVRSGTVAVAISGGKDSAVALALTRQYFARRPTVRVVALSVDEGIAGYRAATLEAATSLTRALGVEHVVVRARDELGSTTDAAARALPGVAPCSFCGVWRRQLLNTAARRLGADHLVLGFNLDDLAQTVLMNLARADLARMGRMAPHRSRQPGFVPRLAPLASVPEREVFLFAHLVGLPFAHAECPHADRASRNVFREVLWQLEDQLPGTRHGLMRTHHQVVRLLERSPPPGAPGRCGDCGEPSTAERCRACEYLKSVGSPPIGEVSG